jgi:hypothetical protein
MGTDQSRLTLQIGRFKVTAEGALAIAALLTAFFGLLAARAYGWL